MKNDSDFRKKVKGYIQSMNYSNDVYSLFRQLNYPEQSIFDPSYIKPIREFSFAKEEKEKIKKIHTVMSIDKLNVFLIETTSLTKPLVRYIANKFAEMYTRCLLIITTDYSEIQFVFPDYEKKEVGKHKLKTTILILRKDELYYTDIEIIRKLYLQNQKKTWREIWRQYLSPGDMEALLPIKILLLNLHHGYRQNLNALFINEELSQDKRLIKLNKVAIQQMRLLTEDKSIKKLESKETSLRKK